MKQKRTNTDIMFSTLYCWNCNIYRLDIFNSNSTKEGEDMELIWNGIYIFYQIQLVLT